MRYLIICSMTILMPLFGWSQKFEEITHREVNVHHPDSSIQATILVVQKKLKLNNSVYYSWYYNNSILCNQGDYKGKLLDGEYQVTATNEALLVKGQYSLGSRTGAWKTWNKKGQLRSTTDWKKGKKNGPFKSYSDGWVIAEGQFKNNLLSGTHLVFDSTRLIQKSRYKKGLLHGIQFRYAADTLSSKTRYKKGVLVVNKEKTKKQKKEQKNDDNENEAGLKEHTAPEKTSSKTSKATKKTSRKKKERKKDKGPKAASKRTKDA